MQVTSSDGKSTCEEVSIELWSWHGTSIFVDDFLNFEFPLDVRRLEALEVQPSSGGNVEGSLADQRPEGPSRYYHSVDQGCCKQCWPKYIVDISLSSIIWVLIM